MDEKTIEFIKKAVAKHGDAYDYRKTEFTAATKKITIICRKHGEFQQVARYHLAGQGCPLCGKEKRAEFLRNSRRGKRKGEEVVGDVRELSFGELIAAIVKGRLK